MRFELSLITTKTRRHEESLRGLVSLCPPASKIHLWRAGLCGMFFLLFPSVLASQAIPSDKELLESAQGGGMASYAELNGYPGPKHIVEMQNEIGLTEEQLKQIESIFDEMHEKARAKGELIVMKEERLNGLFKSGRASEEDVQQLAAEIGRLRGELRAIHLIAHLQATKVLTREQTAMYVAIRNKTRDIPAHEHR